MTLMKGKRFLKPKKIKTFIVEDLTPLRSKLLKIVKDQPEVETAFAREGRILAYVKGKPRPVVVETPDDLSKVGFTDVNLKDLGLQDILA